MKRTYTFLDLVGHYKDNQLMLSNLKESEPRVTKAMVHYSLKDVLAHVYNSEFNQHRRDVYARAYSRL